MKRIGLILVAGMAGLLLLAGVGTATAYFVMQSVNPTSTAEAGEWPEIDLNKAETVNLKFTTNLAEERRYINVSFDLVVRDAKEKQRLEKSLPLVRDLVVEALNSKRAVDVTGENGRERLKQEIQEQVNQLLGGQIVLKVLITDFVVQF